MTFRNPGGRGRGGAVAAQGTLTVVGCTFASNRVSESSSWVDATWSAGGAVYVEGGHAAVEASQFVGNNAPAGGALANAGGIGITNCALVRNVARTAMVYFAPIGGAICNSGHIGLLNCSLAENVAGGTDIFGGWGGALANYGGTVAFAYCTIASNRIPRASGAPGQTAGAGLYVAAGTLSLASSLLAGNTIGGAFEPQNAAGSVQDLGRNLSSDATPGLNAPGSLNHSDPFLAPLGDYRGPTLSMALRTGSPALDAGDPADCPAADQRGMPRPQGAACDLGALERNWLAVQRLADNRVVIQGTGVPGQPCRLQGSTDLKHWQDIETVPAVNGWATFTPILPDPGSAGFFRIVQPGSCFRVRPRGFFPDPAFGREPSHSTGGTRARVATSFTGARRNDSDGWPAKHAKHAKTNDGS
jgi:hypothetical protein